MNLFERMRDVLGSSSRRLDEGLYEVVAREIASGIRREGLWLMAIADASGDVAKANSLYIRYRVESLKNEASEIVACRNRLSKDLSAEQIDMLYGQVAEELSGGDIDKQVYARAYSESGGDEGAARAKYILQRVVKLAEELKTAQEMRLAEARARKFMEEKEREISIRRNLANEDLIKAVKDGNMMIAKSIMESGIRPDGVDLSGSTLIQLASRNGDAPMVKLLQRYGAK